MKQTLLVFSYVAKVAGFIGALNAIPGVSPQTAVIIFFIASLVKDTANRIDDFLTTNYLPPGKGGFSRPGFLLALALAGALALGLALVGCAGSSGVSTPVTPPGGNSTNTTIVTPPALTLEQQIALDFKGATNDALSFANALQKLNNGNALPPSVVTTILTLTHNSGDTATAATLNNLLGQFIGATAAARASGQPSIPVANTILAPANVNATVQTVAPASNPPLEPLTNGTISL